MRLVPKNMEVFEDSIIATLKTNCEIKNMIANESEESSQNVCEEPIDAVFNHFDLDTPQVSPEERRSGRKIKFTQPLDVNPKRKKYQ